MSRRGLALLLLCLVTPAAAAPAPRLLARMTHVGPAPGELVLPEVTVVLGLRDRAGLDAAIAAQQDPRAAGYRRWLDAAEIADRFGVRRAHYERVRAWLVAHGFRITADSPHRASLSLTGTAAQVEAAFKTRLALYRDGKRTYRVPTADVVLPSDLEVQGVLGLDDLPVFHPLVKLGPDAVALAPADVARVYATDVLAGRGLTGTGRSVAVIGRSNFDDADVATFKSLFGTPASPAPVKVAAAGRLPDILSDPREETEVLLDVQWGGALAPQAQVIAVLALPSTAGGGDIPQALRAAVEQRAGDVISMSFGLCEPDTRPATSEYFDALYAVANAQGQTVVVSSGDDGATDCGGNDPTLAVNALAASPHAIAVGGTQLDPLFDQGGSATGYGSESAWNDAGGAGGGGQSARYARPSFQIGLGFDGRVLPDVSLAASPSAPGYVVVRDGAPRIVGGTSASTPVLASMLALVNEAHGVQGLGQLLPAVYRLGAAQVGGTHAPVFHDVTAGGNGGFQAHAGFDLATGWGSPIADAFADGLDDVPAGPCDQDLDCMVPGGGGRQRSCVGEWLVEHAALARSSPKAGYPVGTPASTQTCRDGDPACDADGVLDGACTIRVALCVSVADARARDKRGRLRCVPRPTRSVRLVVPRPGDTQPAAASNRQALTAAIAALPEEPAGLRDACTATVPVSVPVGTRSTLKARVRAAGGGVARVTLACSP